MSAKTAVFPVLRRKGNFNNKPEEEEEDEAAAAEKRRAMFYSQCLLSSKGQLGAIWVAGYFFKRLRKHQVIDTDITSSVDKIILEGLPSVTYRILAYLLLGVARIYSRKVEYLFQDCHETVSDINRFSVGKRSVSFRDIVRSSHSITLPENYELDSFQLEVPDVARRGNIARSEDISLRADIGQDVVSQYCLDKLRFEEVSTLWEDMHDVQTSHEVMMQQETCLCAQTPDKVVAEPSTSAHTPPDDVRSPYQMETDVEVHSPGHMKNFKTSKERLRELRFTGEEDIDVDSIFELDVELLNMINDYQVQTADERDEDALKQGPLENQEYVILNEKEVPSTTEKTHDIEIADAGAVATPEFMVLPTPVKTAAAATPKFVAVPTPAKKEKIRRPCKRKCLFDESTVLDNEIMKKFIKDASDLVCKRRKAPHTVIDLWRLHHRPAFSKNFLEPLIPCVALEIKYVHCEHKTERTDPSPSQAVELLEPIEITQAPDKQPDVATPNAYADSRPLIAPGTPVQCPISARIFRSFRAADSDGEGGQLYENMRKESSVFGEVEDSFVPSLMDEMDANEGDSQELQKNKKLSARTRTVARYLHRVIQRKKQQGVEAITLLPIVERKSKKENARLFFELLVLISGGLMNVVQEKAFGDVVLRETPQLEASWTKS